jgi:hypothetical protein
VLAVADEPGWEIGAAWAKGRGSAVIAIGSTLESEADS